MLQEAAKGLMTACVCSMLGPAAVFTAAGDIVLPGAPVLHAGSLRNPRGNRSRETDSAGALGSSLPAPWTNRDIGTTGLAGSASTTATTFSIAGSGNDIWGTADAFQFVSQSVSGDVQIVARVASLQSTNTYAKAGVMIRQTTRANSANVILDVRPNGVVEFMARTAAGFNTTFLAGATQPAPAWLKLARVGATVSGWVSADGVRWSLIGNTLVTMSSSSLIGLAVTSHDVTKLNVATFDGVGVTVPPAGVVVPPAAPGSPSPAPGAASVGTSVQLTWIAAGAISYDVNLGTSNPPKSASTNLVDASFVATGLTSGATYYWQVVAHNSAGATAGPVWSFTTVVAAPGVPTPLSPAPGATGSVVNPTLTWTSVGATAYDLAFGTSNPPSRAATNLASPSFTPATLANGTTYYWQVTARNTAGATVGALVWFTTVAASAVPAAPSAYNAVSDRNAYAKPQVPTLGAAGYTFNDPTFGSKIARVTDGATRPGTANRSYRVASNAHLSVWNANSTIFYVISNDGTVIPYQFDPTTMKASRFQASGSGDGGMTLRFYVEPHFSMIDPNVIYGAGGYNNRSIMQYDFRTGTYSTLLDLDTVTSGLANTYVGTVITGGTSSENLLTFFGGPGQDSHYYLMWAPLNNLGARKFINTVQSTINGVSTNTPLNFHIHSASIDRSGRYVFIYPTSGDLAAPRNAAQVFLWDTVTDLFTPLPASALSGGHDAAGFGYWVNQDCCTATAWDAMQWQFRYLDNPTHPTDMIQQVLRPQEIYAADHTSWSNARPDALVPVISSTYRYGDNTTPWRAWDEEIIGIDTTGGTGGLVYRFAHHRSKVASDTDPSVTYFWYQPIANVSPNGQWVIFTSNWEKTLGKDASEGTFRQDVFMVHLTPQ